jgi:hypothetical protein
MGNHGPGVSCCGILTSLFGITEMNERIKLLEKQAWEFVDKTWNWANANNPSQATLFKAKFAELIVKECLDIVADADMTGSWITHPKDVLCVACDQVKKHFEVEE